LITILIVDDHSMVAECFQRALLFEADMTVVAVAHTVADAQAAVTSHRPDVVLMDYALPDGDGIAAARTLIRQLPSTKVILVTATNDRGVVRRAIQAGCVGYLEKAMAFAQLVAAVRAAAEGATAISPEHLARAMQEPTTDSVRLTARERDVLRLIADGCSNDAIARQLSLSLHTVRTHVQSILSKLRVHSKLQAAAFARDHGLAGHEPVAGN
jgi:DNA-binding NarL/FixJ family response regulator